MIDQSNEAVHWKWIERPVKKKNNSWVERMAKEWSDTELYRWIIWLKFSQTAQHTESRHQYTKYRL